MSTGLRRTQLITNPPSKSKGNPKDNQKKTLWRLNVIAAIVHFSSFIAALVVSIIYASKSYQTELTTDFNTVLNSLGSYSIIWVDLPFPIITAIFHASIAFIPSIRSYYYKAIFEETGSILRWLEYSITASLMTWVILQLSGVTNILTLILTGVIANIALQWQGYLQEKLKGVSWVPTIVGWLIFSMQWSIILSYFFTTLNEEQNVPWFVYTIVIGLLIQFSLFGLVQLTYMLAIPKFMKSAYAAEIAFLVLSLTSKLFLTWNLLIGIITR